MLIELKRPYPRPSELTLQHADSSGSEMSGVEVVSPHKLIAVAQENPLLIPGIGEVRTSWIGHKGVCEMKTRSTEERAEAEVKAVMMELRVLATECMKAFKAAGMEESDDPQVKKAVGLCSSYLPQTREQKQATCVTIADLWKGEKIEPAVLPSQSKRDLASSLLGQKLVDTLTEEQRQPPDVSKLTQWGN